MIQKRADGKYVCVSIKIYLWELPWTSFWARFFIFLIAKQCPGLIWRLQLDCARKFDLEKIFTALEKRLFQPTNYLPNGFIIMQDLVMPISRQLY